MTPFDIVKVLTAAAPVAASVASIVKSVDNEGDRIKPEIIVEKEKPIVHNTINISVVNNFYTKPDSETLHLATEAQSDLLEKVGVSEKRYDL